MATSSLIPARVQTPFLEWKDRLAAQRARQAALIAGITILTALAAWRCEVRVSTFVTGIHKGLPVVGMFFPPAWNQLPSMIQPVMVTLVLALIATIVGMCLSLPCALAASSNLSPAALRLFVRGFIAFERGLPEIVQLLLLIAIFGLGTIPGLIALSISSIGMLAKLLADAIEEIEPHMIEAVAATGATSSQTIRYAIIPQILPAMLANGLFRFEFNVRAGVILGAVGGGGIGYVMSSSMNSMDYQRACMATLLTFALVFSAERLSDFLRNRILNGGSLR